MQVFEIKRRFTNEVIFSAECETLGGCVELAYLKGAYLKGAYLKGADLEGAYLKEANLEGAYLEGAYLGTPGKVQNFTTIAKIGSRGATLQVFQTENGLFFSTGCQTLINEETFVQRVKDTHAGTKYERQYLAAVDFVRVLFSEWPLKG
jgi:uncharacterized protein YjbI with pentapeptide repeats